MWTARQHRCFWFELFLPVHRGSSRSKNEMNAAEQVLAAGRDGDVALICGEKRLTYAELRDRTTRTAGWLRGYGLQAGDRVVIAGSDGLGWVVAWLGAIWAGGVSVAVNPRMASDDLGMLFREAGVKLCLADPEAASNIATVTLLAPMRILDLEAAGAIEAQPIAAARAAGRAPAFWLCSSGTTGRSKPVVFAHDCVPGCAAFARDVLGLGASDRLYATSRLFFAYPLANSLLAGLLLGASVTLDPIWPQPDRVAAIAQRTRPTAFLGVPTLYHQLLRAGLATVLAEAGVRHYISAGEALPASISDGWRQATGGSILSGYGMSETLALVLYRDTGGPEGAVAAPLAEVREDAGPAVEAAAPRRLWFRHPSMALGYHDRPELQQRCFQDGWVSSGDLFHPRGPGRWEFAGREDAMLKVAGQWVDTVALQEELARQLGESVAELSVVALAGSEGLAAPGLFVVPARGEEARARARLDEVCSRMPPHQRPRFVYWLAALPRTATGKLHRAELLALHRQRMEASQN
jgi:acyl-coenzyme A synthetase/AMP-(fatty) acid ligase